MAEGRPISHEPRYRGIPAYVRIAVEASIALLIVFLIVFPEDYLLGFPVKSAAMLLALFAAAAGLAIAVRPVPGDLVANALLVLTVGTLLAAIGLAYGGFPLKSVLQDIELTVLTIVVPLFILAIQQVYEIPARRIVA